MQIHSRIRIAAGLIGLAVLAGTGSATAQTANSNINPILDCANHGGCTVQKYGLTHPDDLAFPVGEPIAGNALSKGHESFKGSYFYRRNQSDPRIDLGECAAEAAFVPLEGTVLLRERNDCIPPDLPATGQCRSCLPPGGCTDGATCSSGWDCVRGICNNLDAGCPVEIATDIGTPGLGNVFQSYFQTVAPALYVATAFNGALVTDADHLFSPPKRAGIGRRFIRPAGGTVLYWIDLLNGGGNTTGENQSVLFCDDELGGAICNAATPRFNKYPVITVLPDLAREGRNEAPFIFPDDIQTDAPVQGNFDTDQTYVPPGQIYGNCTNPIPFPIPGLPTPQVLRQGCSAPGALANTQCTAAGDPRPCCTGLGTGTCGPADSNALCTGPRLPWFCCTGAQAGNCGTECVVAPGVDTGPCNLADRGVRFNRDHSSDDLGNPDPEKCNANPFRFRGTLGQNCSVVTFYNECLQLQHNEACVSNGSPFLCCTGAGTGTCGTAQTCILRGNCANNAAIVCDANAANGNECAGVGGACNLGRTGRCSVSTGVRCSPGESPYPRTDHNFLKWGDPHPRIGLVNFGPQTRPDMDCDGLEDPTLDLLNNTTLAPVPDGLADTVGDACPYYSETNTVDTNPSPAINTYNRDGSGRANECECGDSNRDGLVDVSDLVDINTKIFTPPGSGQPGAGTANLYAPLSDANEDDAWNVSDIVGVNLDIFNILQTSRCGRSPIIGQ